MKSFAAVVFAASVIGIMSILPSVTAMECRDESGSSVDWFVIFKYAQEFRYSYADPNTALHQSPYTLDSTADGALAQTMSQAYHAGYSYVMYNDQPPTGSASNIYGHTKGTLGLSSTAGFWLAHSVPHFPASGASYPGLPSSAQDNGQAFICVTLDRDMLNGPVANALTLNRPFIYDSFFSTAVKREYSYLVDVVEQRTHSTDPISNHTLIETSHGATLSLFSKTSKWNKDLYSQLIAPTLNDGILVETWMNGAGGPLQNDCNQPSTYNVASVKFGDTTWSETEDHSKWAITKNNDYVCICDINRMASQADRGGGGICVSDTNLHTAVVAAIQELYTTPPRGGCANMNPFESTSNLRGPNRH